MTVESSIVCQPGSELKSSDQVVRFSPIYNAKEFSLEDSSFFAIDDSTEFETLKFYVSGIELLFDGEVVVSDHQRLHLVDVSRPQSQYVTLRGTAPFNQVRFQLGIDSTTNVSGAMGGDLDPTRGMYWTWQSGYVNVKLEGRSPRSKARNGEFQFHVGGYASPFNGLRTVVLVAEAQEAGAQGDGRPTNSSVGPSDIENHAVIELDVSKFLNEVNLQEINHVMSPTKTAMELSDSFVKCFRLKNYRVSNR